MFSVLFVCLFTLGGGGSVSHDALGQLPEGKTNRERGWGVTSTPPTGRLSCFTLTCLNGSTPMFNMVLVVMQRTGPFTALPSPLIHQQGP